MMSGDIVYDKIHSRHNTKWSLSLTSTEGSQLQLCVACVTEMMDSEDIASVRKAFALSAVSEILKCSPGALKELLQQDHRVLLCFTASLLGILQSAENPATVERAQQVLVQLLLELRSEVAFGFVLDEIHKQLSDRLCVKGFLPLFNLLGTMVEAVPNVAHCLVTQFVLLLEHLCSALLYPDEALKASALYVWLQVFRAVGGSSAKSLPVAIRDRVCVLLRQTLANAGSAKLIKNSVGLLWLLVQHGETVSVLMNSPYTPTMWDQNTNLYNNSSQTLSQNSERQCTEQCQLPLILKQLLLSADETLQVASAKCIASVLVHSPSQYCAPFIKADVPEFLFDRLASANSEMMLWSAYSCLVLLTEDPLFFSQCHSIYGVESLVHSLKEALQMSNLEVHKQGLLLLTLILERQPPSVRLLPSAPVFVAVSEAVVAGVSSPCLLVATQGASAASALFRLNHQSLPVQYREIERLVEAVSSRFSELHLLSSGRQRSSGSVKRSGLSKKAFRSEGFLLQALVCFQAACRLAEECASDPVLKENVFTAPVKTSQTEDSLESLCHCLLHCCDSVWIPTVTRMCERAANPHILQKFYSILASQFSLLPRLMPLFANKLSSSGFYRLTLEHKGLFCAASRNVELNASCCDFLQKLSMCLLPQSEAPSESHQQDVEEIENLLLHNLPSLCCPLSDWPSLLYENPGPQLSEHSGPRSTQYCLVVILHLAFQQGDRLLPDQTVFSSVLWLLHSVQEQVSCVLPRCVLRSALYLLAVTQDNSPSLDRTPLNCINTALSSCQSFSSLYVHHPALLHFICRYPELAEKFGAAVLELWLTKQTRAVTDVAEPGGETKEDQTQHQKPDKETVDLLNLIEKYPAVVITLLDMLFVRQPPLADRAYAVLELLLQGERKYELDLCAKVRPVLLKALRQFSLEMAGRALGERRPKETVNSLPLVLKLLCVTQATDPPLTSSYSKMNELHFKLLYHVSNIAGRITSTNTESLLPALNYLYCGLSLCPEHCTDRAVSMLLSNSGLMDQLQTLLSSSSSSSSSSSAPYVSPSLQPPSSLLCCSHLLLSSLITLQHAHTAQVHRSIGWSLDTAVQRLLLQKRSTDNLLLASNLRLLQALLDVDLESGLVSVTTGPGLVGPRPLGFQDGALYPLGFRGAQCLTIALSGLLFQKHELLLRASVNCLSSLLGFLQRKSHITAKYVVCHPWTRFLLCCLIGPGESCLVHPAILRLITLLLKHSSTAVPLEPDLLRVMEAVEKTGVKELSQEASQAFRLLLTQVQSSVLQPPLTEEHKLRLRKMLEELSLQTPAQSSTSTSTSTVLHVGDVSVCWSDFTLMTPG
ncbi:meiosis inhibitor protein 1 isoform X1 [Cynoglossus semilaevis]|nr:coiled-coil domain-containing protein 134 isoform X1 [Cynoglossus semilaevis]XP_016895774.1 coiled-coil domain-containing protein 134 isoform X1 [Cynoglossus semilaevis]XP_024920061.1 coiled-coil domain-containing protein 134 isoform X1 [Cynoglossus semilaevis]